MAVSNSGTLLDFASLCLWNPAASKLLKNGSKIGPASWLFKNLSSTFPASYFWDGLRAFLPIADWQVSSMKQLRQIHFVRMVPVLIVRIMFSAWGGYPSIDLQVPTSFPYYAFQGSYHPYSWQFIGDEIFVHVPVTDPVWHDPGIGNFGFSRTWTGSPLYQGISVDSHYHPPKSILDVRLANTHPAPRLWRCNNLWYFPDHYITIT
jgi:hypothetical protein